MSNDGRSGWRCVGVSKDGRSGWRCVGVSRDGRSGSWEAEEYVFFQGFRANVGHVENT